MKKTKAIHIGIIILGIIFISISSFHSNVWFDESYSVALCEHSFKEIWQIGGNDVHPVLYYMLLHILYLIFVYFSTKSSATYVLSASAYTMV